MQPTQLGWEGGDREALPRDILSTALRKSFYSMLKNVYK